MQSVPTTHDSVKSRIASATGRERRPPGGERAKQRMRTGTSRHARFSSKASSEATPAPSECPVSTSSYPAHGAPSPTSSRRSTWPRMSEGTLPVRPPCAVARSAAVSGRLPTEGDGRRT